MLNFAEFTGQLLNHLPPVIKRLTEGLHAVKIAVDSPCQTRRPHSQAPVAHRQCYFWISMPTTWWRNRDIELRNRRRAAEPETDSLLKVVDRPKE